MGDLPFLNGFFAVGGVPSSLFSSLLMLGLSFLGDEGRDPGRADEKAWRRFLA